jgi:endonuclease/exonuclease/phosphatase family metal-dependent hydrolase
MMTVARTSYLIGIGTILLTGCMPSFEVVAPDSDRQTCLDPSTDPPILWFTPVGTGENRALGDWCENVGPPIIRQTPAADFSNLPDDSLDVLVWNVEAGDGWVTEFLEQNGRIECSGPTSRVPDDGLHFVMLAQEALRRSNEIPREVVNGALLPRVGSGDTNPGAFLDLIQVAERCGLAIFYLPGSRNGPDEYAGLREDKGNAILSTLPLQDFAGIELPFESIRRVVPVATVEPESGRKIRFASAHFITTPPPWRVVMTGNSARERQALGLIDGLMRIEAAYGETAVVLGGDLNTFSNRETALRKLRRYFGESPPPFNEPTRGPIHADHILFRANTFFDSRPDHIIPGSYQRIDDLYYSDHYPVRARVRFGE